MQPWFFGSTMQEDTTFVTNLPIYEHVAFKTAEQRRSEIEHPGSGSAPSLVPKVSQ